MKQGARKRDRVVREFCYSTVYAYMWLYAYSARYFFKVKFFDLMNFIQKCDTPGMGL